MFKTFILKNIVHFLLRERLETVPAPAEDFSGTAVGGIGVLPSLASSLCNLEIASDRSFSLLRPMLHKKNI